MSDEMKKLARKFASLLVVAFTALPVAGAGEPKPIPSVAQVPQGLLPVTNPQIPGGPTLKDPMPLPQSPFGIGQTSLEFLEESSTLSVPPGITPVNPEEVIVGDPLKDVTLLEAIQENSEVPQGQAVIYAEPVKVVKSEERPSKLEAALDRMTQESASAVILNRPLRQEGFEKIVERSIREGTRITVVVLHGRTILLSAGSGDELAASQARAMRRILRKAAFVFQTDPALGESQVPDVSRYLEALKISRQTLDSQQARRRARAKVNRLIERFLGSEKE